MICASIQNRDLQEVLSALERVEMAEIRLDRCPLGDEDIDLVFSSDLPLVATCRVSEVLARDPYMNSPECTWQEESKLIKASRTAELRLMRAIEAGAKYVDVELEAPRPMSRRLRKAAAENGVIFIRSWHDFEGTDSLEGLKAIAEKCLSEGAEVVKIVTTARDRAQAQRVLDLYGCGIVPPGRLLAFAMGGEGVWTRTECLKLGAPYTYAALDGDATAPGQPEYAALCRQVYGDGTATFWNNASVAGMVPEETVAPSRGETPVVKVPCSKSFAQRAILAAALADGESVLEGYTPCGDSEAAVAVARALGADIEALRGALRIRGIAARQRSLDLNGLHVGESGLLTRLSIPLCAALSKNPVTITGEKTLSTRPLTGVAEMMDALGARVDFPSPASTVPLTVSGPLRGGRADLSGRNGSQLISGLLMALPLMERNTTLRVSEPKSIPYMFITMDVLRRFGVKVSNEMLGGQDFLRSEGDWNYCSGMVFKIRGGQRYTPARLQLEGDWSAGATFLVAGAVFGTGAPFRGLPAPLELSGLDTASLQADLTVMDVLMDAGASLSQLDGQTGNIVVQRSPLGAFTTDASHCPDLFPVLSVLAAFCEGESAIKGVSRLIHKESNRAEAIVEMLTQMGVPCRIRDDELFISGHSLARRCLTGTLLRGGDYTSRHDHRMAMALKVASLGADGPVRIDDTDCLAKSFPDFLTLFCES